MSSPRKKHRVLNAFFLVFVILITLWLVLSSGYLVLRTIASNEQKLPNLFGYQITAEMDGNMADVVPNGSVVLAVEKPNPSVGDIILFREESTGTALTGRIKEILSFDNEPQYSVSFDGQSGITVEVYRSSVYGQVSYIIPYLGYVVDYLNSFNGILYAVLVPGIALIVILVIRMIFSIRASKREEGEEDDEEDSFTIASVPIEPESNTELAYHNEELDAVWKRRAGGSGETDEIVTDQDMIYQMSNLNNTFAADAVKQQEQEEAEKIVSELRVKPVIPVDEPVEKPVSEVQPAKKVSVSDYSSILDQLGKENEESSDLVSLLRQYGITDEESVESVRKAAPFVRPVVTDHSVDLNLKETPAQRVRVVSDENGKYLIVESDQVETKIKLPF